MHPTMEVYEEGPDNRGHELERKQGRAGREESEKENDTVIL